MKKILSFLLFAGLAIVALFWYRGHMTSDKSTPEDIFNTTTASVPHDLPEVAPAEAVSVSKGAGVATTARKTSVKAQAAEPYNDEITASAGENHSLAVTSSLRNSPKAQAQRAKWLAEQKKKPANTPGGFFMDEDPKDLPPVIKAAEKEWAENRRTGKKPGQVTFLGRTENTSKATSGGNGNGGGTGTASTAKLKFLGRSPNN